VLGVLLISTSSLADSAELIRHANLLDWRGFEALGGLTRFFDEESGFGADRTLDRGSAFVCNGAGLGCVLNSSQGGPAVGRDQGRGS
jgi:hypothetical protein